MTESMDPGANPEAPPPPPPEPEVTVGTRLREARERLGLSVSEVAQRLKFAPRQIEALEADQAAALPGLTFVRGFVRSYAKLVGLEADPLVSALERKAVLEAHDSGPNTLQLQRVTATETFGLLIDILGLLLKRIGGSPEPPKLPLPTPWS